MGTIVSTEFRVREFLLIHEIYSVMAWTVRDREDMTQREIFLDDSPFLLWAVTRVRARLECCFRCGDASLAKLFPRDARLSARDTLPGCLSCLLRQTLSTHLSFTLIFWQTAASSPSRGMESRDGTINASTNDDAIYRHDFNATIFRLFLSSKPRLSVSVAASPLPVIPSAVGPHCLFHLDAPSHSPHYISPLCTVTYP